MKSILPFCGLAALTIVPAADSFVVENLAVCSSSSSSYSGSGAHSLQTKSALKVWTTTATEEEEADRQRDPFFDRRSLLLAGASSVATGFVLNENKDALRRAPAILTSIEASSEAGGVVAPATTSVSSVEEALTIIESLGDKRFLHAVVASDYKFLYEQTPRQNRSGAPKSVLSDIDAEAIFSKKINLSSSPRSIVLAASGNLAPGKAPSLWPLETARCSVAGSCDSIHYAWPEQGGAIPRRNNDEFAARSAMIVDGIDCGKMSLEDALEGDMQVLVQAPTYLLVPSYMESNLRRGLQGAFLI